MRKTNLNPIEIDLTANFESTGINLAITQSDFTIPRSMIYYDMFKNEEIDTAEIFDNLIKTAGKNCKKHSSDILNIWLSHKFSEKRIDK